MEGTITIKEYTKGENYKFITIKKLAKRLMKASFNKSIGFTFDDDINITEPTGWYGVVKTNMYDGEALLFGYFGGGVLTAFNLSDEEYTIETFIKAICAFYVAEKGNYHNNKKTPNKNTILCVDIEEYKNA